MVQNSPSVRMIPVMGMLIAGTFSFLPCIWVRLTMEPATWQPPRFEILSFCTGRSLGIVDSLLLVAEAVTVETGAGGGQWRTPFAAQPGQEAAQRDELPIGNIVTAGAPALRGAQDAHVCEKRAMAASMSLRKLSSARRRMVSALNCLRR